jgi:hypothetical protein
MTYHDRRLLEGQKAESKKRIKLSGSVLGGAFSLTLFPKSPRIVTGSIEGDWEAVGNDIRKAMKSYDA